MTITTSKGNEYEAVLAYAPTYDGALMLHIHDERVLSEIAKEFEGVQWVKTDGFDPTIYRGYGILNLINRTGDAVQLKLYKE